MWRECRSTVEISNALGEKFATSRTTFTATKTGDIPRRKKVLRVSAEGFQTAGQCAGTAGQRHDLQRHRGCAAHLESQPWSTICAASKAVLHDHLGLSRQDASGADTHVTTNPHGTFLITDHPTGGVQLWRILGTAKVLQSYGYKHVDGAKWAVDRMFGEVA